MLTKNSFATDMLISSVFGVVRAGTSILVALVSMAMELRTRTRREPPSCPDQERRGNASPLNTFPWDNTMNPRPMVIACIAATVITGACVTRTTVINQTSTAEPGVTKGQLLSKFDTPKRPTTTVAGAESPNQANRPANATSENNRAADSTSPPFPRVTLRIQPDNAYAPKEFVVPSTSAMNLHVGDRLAITKTDAENHVGVIERACPGDPVLAHGVVVDKHDIPAEGKASATGTTTTSSEGLKAKLDRQATGGQIGSGVGSLVARSLPFGAIVGSILGQAVASIAGPKQTEQIDTKTNVQVTTVTREGGTSSFSSIIRSTLPVESIGSSMARMQVTIRQDDDSMIDLILPSPIVSTPRKAGDSTAPPSAVKLGYQIDIGDRIEITKTINCADVLVRPPSATVAATPSRN